jgi:hypothetical protein
LPVEGHAFEATYNKDEKECTQWFCCQKKKADFNGPGEITSGSRV